jgi:hypothetical protein
VPKILKQCLHLPRATYSNQVVSVYVCGTVLFVEGLQETVQYIVHCRVDDELNHFLALFRKGKYRKAIIYSTSRLLHVYSVSAKHTKSNLTFRGPCIVIYSYNKSQQDALFLKFILVKNSTCFGQIYCPSSGVLILYTQQ